MVPPRAGKLLSVCGDKEYEFRATTADLGVRVIHVIRRFLPLLLGPLGALLGCAQGLLLHQALCLSLRILWPTYLWTMHSLIGLLAYPLGGLLLALPFLYAYPGAVRGMRSPVGQAQDGHLRLWIAVLFAGYLPVGVAVLYELWWNAPSLPVPFTDVWLYAGSSGDLLVFTLAMVVFGPFCAAGVERLLRGTPGWLRLLIGPPLASWLIIGAVFAVVLAGGGMYAAGVDPGPFGPLHQPWGTAGWDSSLVIALVTLVSSSMAGVYAMMMVALPVLYGLDDPSPAASRRRWALPVFGTAVAGVLAVVAIVHAHGLDSVQALAPRLTEGRYQLTGQLIAPADSDVLRLKTEGHGYHVLAFPRPTGGDRHQVYVPGFPLPSPSLETGRYLVNVPEPPGTVDVQVTSGWPQRAGISSYSGPVSLQALQPGEPRKVVGRASLDVGPGEAREWTVDLARGAAELDLGSAALTYWTVLAPTTYPEGYWAWETGWSTVDLQVLAGDRVLYKRVLDIEGIGCSGVTLMVSRAPGAEQPPCLRLRLTPSRPGKAGLEIPVVGEGFDARTPRTLPTLGPAFVGIPPGQQVTVNPPPGGISVVAELHHFGPSDVTLTRMGDDGEPHEVGGSLLLMGRTMLRVEGAAGPSVVALGTDRAGPRWASWY